MSTDPQRFFVPVNTDRRRALKFDSRATFLLYQKYGHGFFAALYEPDPNAPEPAKGQPPARRIKSHETFVYFLWAGLLRDAEDSGEELTLEAVHAMVVPTSFNELAAALLIALSATRRAPQKDEPKNV